MTTRRELSRGNIGKKEEEEEEEQVVPTRLLTS
jgi:hypothetical protein